MHYHIFKNAGTTIEWVLANNFRRKFARLDGKDRFFIITQNELLELLKSRPDIRAISTHTLFPPKPNIDGLHIHDLVLVRHPLDRLMSMYDFYHRANDKSDPLGEAARKLEPEKFFAFLIQKYPHLINNAQVNYLNGGRKIPRDPDLQRAIRVIEQFSIVGTADLFDMFMVSAEYALSPYFGALDFSYLPQNVAVGRSPELSSRLEILKDKCGLQFYERLRKLNKLDLELNDFVTKELCRRFERIPDHERRMMDFKNRCSRQAKDLVPAR